MKKFDLHIHTKQTFQDSNGFVFSLDTLRQYVEDRKIDCIAITNHNIFDSSQFKEIQQALLGICVVLPGIEINVGQNAGHLLCIADEANYIDFAEKCNAVSAKINSVKDSLNIGDLKSIFGSLSNYLWIPHSSKKPHVDKAFIDQLQQYIFCGEVQNVKDFKYYYKDKNKPTPLLFSDFRPQYSIDVFPNRQTYIDINEINIASLNYVLRDKTKVALSKKEGNERFEIINGLEISTGLNVILGDRSSGKTFTLDKIFQNNERVKYIEQFSLLEKDPKKSEKEFESSLSNDLIDFRKEYLAEFGKVVDDVSNISLEENERTLDEYLESLLKCASEIERQDVFSKCSLWSEENFYIENHENLKKLINAVIALLDTTDYRDTIEKHIEKQALIELLESLICIFRQKYEDTSKKIIVNSLISNIKNELNINTAATNVSDFSITDYLLNKRKISAFEEIALELQKPKLLQETSYNKFRTVVERYPIEAASDLQEIFKTRTRYAEAIKLYGKPYKYLVKLKELDIPTSQCYLGFTRISYSVKNQYNADLSGGERAEYKLLHEIDSASTFDMLLIDEPESSFDNIFLLTDVNRLIKTIAEKMPVIVVTHNSTVGMSIHPDYLIYTKREIINGEAVYKRYFGSPGDKYLTDIDGDTISTYELTIDSLEAGKDAYKERAESYERIRNKE